MIPIDPMEISPYLGALLSLILFLLLVRRQKARYEMEPRISLRRDRSQSFIAKALKEITDKRPNYKSTLTVMRNRILDLEAKGGVRADVKRFLEECRRMEAQKLLTRKEFTALYREYTRLMEAD